MGTEKESRSKAQYREHCYLSSIMKCNSTREQATRETDKSTRQEWLLRAPIILFVVHPVKQSLQSLQRHPGSYPWCSAALTMFLSTGIRWVTPQFCLSGRFQSPHQYAALRLLLGVFPKALSCYDRLNAYRRRQQQLPIILARRISKTIHEYARVQDINGWCQVYNECVLSLTSLLVWRSCRRGAVCCDQDNIFAI